MCKRKIYVALMVLILPALTWADFLHSSFQPAGLPSPPWFNQGTTGSSSNVQVVGFSTGDSFNVIKVDTLSSQMSNNGDDGGNQSEQNSLSVEHTGTGSVHVSEGNPFFPGIPMVSSAGLGLGLNMGMPFGLGMGGGTPSAGILGLNAFNAGLLGQGPQASAPWLTGQPAIPNFLLP